TRRALGCRAARQRCARSHSHHLLQPCPSAKSGNFQCFHAIGGKPKDGKVNEIALSIGHETKPVAGLEKPTPPSSCSCRISALAQRVARSISLRRRSLPARRSPRIGG